MIYRLEIENFYSVRERQIVDLSVGKKVPDEPGRLVPIHDGAEHRAPRVAAIYGANASGKSNVLRAIAFLSWFIQSSFKSDAWSQLPYRKFETREATDAPTRISVSYSAFEEPLAKNSSKTCPYVYTLELSSRIDGQDIVQRESLYYRPSYASRMKRIFDRDASNAVKYARWVGLGSEVHVLKKILRPNASVIPTLGQMNNQFARTLIQSASTIATNILMTKFEHDDLDLLAMYARNPYLLDALNRDIRRVDLGIDQVEIFEQRDLAIASFSHTGLDQPILMPFESHGTQQFFRIFPMIHTALFQGGVAVIDEFDATIHPSVLREILRWFSDPHRNPNGAQLWMSCQEATLLDDLLKEEVLICQKNMNGATEIYGLNDINGIRRQENFLRNYLGGVYGGIPSIG